MLIDRKFIWLNHRLTERRLTESSFYRKVIMTDFLFRKLSFDRVYFGQKNHMTEKKLRKRLFDRKFI
jgi:hypothetical protein